MKYQNFDIVRSLLEYQFFGVFGRFCEVLSFYRRKMLNDRKKKMGIKCVKCEFC